MQMQRMSISTDAIGDNGKFDPRYTCDIDNSSPELRWGTVPMGTSGFVIVAEDLDTHDGSGLFTHWLIYNIPMGVHHLPAGIPPQESLPNGIRQGINSFGKLGYSGPCPPIGDRPHRYVFRLFALSQNPVFDHRVQRQELLNAIQPHIIEISEIMGRYQRVIQEAG